MNSVLMPRLHSPRYLLVALSLLAGLLSLVLPPALAQGRTIFYLSQDVTCSSIVIDYYVTGSPPPASSVLLEAVSGSTVIGNNDGPGADGSYSMPVTFPPQPPGTQIFGRIRDGATTLQGSPESCSGMTTGGGNVGSDASNAPPWGGYSDGRLNPDPGEYYSVWCEEDHIQVWTVVPAPIVLKSVPLLNVFGLDVGGALDLGDFMSLVRNTEDTITIYGSNGNRAPEPGQKAFSLSECIARNGGLPEAPDTRPSDTGGEEEESSGELCYDFHYFIDRVEVCLSKLGFNNLGIILVQLFLLCTTPFFGLVVGGRVLVYIIRRRLNDLF